MGNQGGISSKNKTTMDELERLYNELPYFDKQKFIGRHLADARQEDFDDAVEDGMKHYSHLDLYHSRELISELVSRGYTVSKE